jgi:hypothetical protein
MSKEKVGGEKQLYEPPQLKVISLRPEEAVLGHCKSSTAGGGPVGLCDANLCKVQGS